MRVLVVMNFGADPSTPQRGRWVVDQVEALQREGLEAELFTFQPGRKNYLPATRAIRQRLRSGNYDLVHAHYGLAGWCALLAGAKPLIVTFHGTDVRHRIVGPMSRSLSRHIALTAGASRALFRSEAGRPGLALSPGRNAVLPCGADLSRFGPVDRGEARERLGLDPDSRYLFFPADPGRPEKRFDRAREVADRTGATLLSGGGIDPEEMSLWFNAANAVLVTSDYEGFGLACLESLACDVPVISTPVGIAPHVLGALPNSLCAEFEPEVWSEFAAGLLKEGDPRTPGRARAESLSARRMADRVALAYGETLGRGEG
ncbi:MAG: glycosyltransferase [Thermoleophilia bacterium]|nr:glycosyltransferase [Thermoleophilia bacterium]